LAVGKELDKAAMKTVLVTGAKGFIGKNLVVALKRKDDLGIIEYDIDSSPDVLAEGLRKADVIYHLAGVNRPQRIEEFTEGNYDLTRQICDSLKTIIADKKAGEGKSSRDFHPSEVASTLPIFVLSSSIQAVLDNPYGVSKRMAEETVFDFGRETGAQVFVFRLHGVFGKWCRPSYNSVVATFCNNIARNLPIEISDPAREIEVVHIDDVVSAFLGVMDGQPPARDGRCCLAEPTYRIALGALAETIRGFRESRVNLLLPDMGNPFIRSLYSTYLSYLPADSFAYALTQKADPRGELAELMKLPRIGQIFVSRTRPGFTRGNHYHDSKVEKFVVIEGDAVIRLRHILGGDVIEYPVSGREFRVVDIPPGYTHSIENVGQNDLIVLFWAFEIFDPNVPDAFSMNV
jgi:UDP-2-acetamido-2,6-beta-L-arabino-hexul-4-ose reductase